MIEDIEPELLAAAARDDGVLVASLSLTDERLPSLRSSEAAGHQLAVRVTTRGHRREPAGRPDDQLGR